MATLSTAARNAAVDAVGALVGATGAFTITANPGGFGTVLWSAACNSPPFGVGGGGVAALDTTGMSAAAIATDSAGGWFLGSSTLFGAFVLRGNVGEVSMDNTAVVTGRALALGDFSITMPAS